MTPENLSFAYAPTLFLFQNCRPQARNGYASSLFVVNGFFGEEGESRDVQTFASLFHPDTTIRDFDALNHLLSASQEHLLPQKRYREFFYLQSRDPRGAVA